jgi:hypothetical protein
MALLTACLALLTLACAAPARAQAPYDDDSTPAGWAWARIRGDQPADFDQRCGKPLDPAQDAGWDDPCRALPPQFLADILTLPKFRDQIVHRRVHLRGARITGNLGLANADIAAEVAIESSRIDGALTLRDSRWEQPLSLAGSRLAGALDARRMRSTSLVDLSATVGAAVLLHGARLGELAMSGARIAGLVDASTLVVDGSVFLNGQANFGGAVSLLGARIGSNLNLSTSTFAASVDATNATIDGDVFVMGRATLRGILTLTGARVHGDIDVSTATLTAGLNADAATVGADLMANRRAKFGGAVSLMAATIGGNLELSTASFAAAVDATNLVVGGDLMIDDAMIGGDLTLAGARVHGLLDMSGATLTGALDADAVTVGQYILANEGATFGRDVTLYGAKVGNNLQLDSATFAGAVTVTNASVGGDVAMNGHARFAGAVNLDSAKVGRTVHMDAAAFAGAVSAANISVGGDLLTDTGTTFAGPLTLRGASIGGSLDLAAARATSIDLSRVVAQELVLEGLRWSCAGAASPASWPLGDARWRTARCGGADPGALPAPAPPGLTPPALTPPSLMPPARTPPALTQPALVPATPMLPTLILRNAHVEALQDGTDTWPPLVDLEGFHYDRLGGAAGTGRDDMRNRQPAQWIDWLARNRPYSEQPYTQLAAVLAASGSRDTAERIQLAGREQERQQAWLRGDIGVYLWLSFLSLVAGYGIGLYTFQVLYCVVVFTVVGAAVLWFSPNARRHGPMWLLGASLHRLLPVIELNKEFKDFFDNPPPTHAYERPNLNRFQVAFFSALAVVGWILGFFLLAAMGGLTQRS